MKDKIIQELKKSEFPDLAFLFSSDALETAPEILKELLEIDKKEFEELLEKPNQARLLEIYPLDRTLTIAPIKLTRTTKALSHLFYKFKPIDRFTV